MARRAEQINPLMLRWARQEAALSLEDAAQKLVLAPSAHKTGADKLRALEAGESKPTHQQLIKIARLYHRPLTTFYREHPPQKSDRGEDFRTLQGHVPARDAALLDALLRDVRARQNLVRALIEEDEDRHPLALVGSLGSMPMDVQAAVQKTRVHLGVDQDNWTQAFGSPHALFTDFRRRVEALGVFVLLIGNLGSHHSNLSANLFRGFAIADPLAPFIVINDQDAKAAWVFTLAHELAHVFVGKTGLSAFPTSNAPQTSKAQIEQFCNDVAGELLLPSALFATTLSIEGPEQAREIVDATARRHNLSEQMVAYRFLRIGLVNTHIYAELQAGYVARWQRLKRLQRDQANQTDGGPNYYAVRKHRLGDALVGLVGQTLRSNQLTHTTAAKMLGVKPTSVDPLLRRAEGVNWPSFSASGT